MAEIDPHYDPEEPQDDDLDAVLSTVAAQGEGEILVKFYKFDKGRGNWIFDAHAVDMPDIMNRIKEEYGGGDYEAVVRRGNRIATRKRFSIMVATKPKPEPQQSSEMMVVIQGMKELVQGMSAGFTQLGQLIVESRQQPPQPHQSPVAALTEMATLMSTMQSMMPKPVQVDPTAQLKATLEMASMLAENMNGGPAEMSPGQVLSKLASDMAPVLTAVLNRPARIPSPKAARQPQPKPATLPQPAPTAPPAPVMQSTNQQGNDPNMLIKLTMKPQIVKILAYANKGITPEEMAPHVIDAIPDAYFDKFGDFVMTESCVSEMIAMVPEAATKRDWFNKLRLEMIRHLTAPEEETIIDDNSNTGLGNDTDDSTAIRDSFGGGGNP